MLSPYGIWLCVKAVLTMGREVCAILLYHNDNEDTNTLNAIINADLFKIGGSKLGGLYCTLEFFVRSESNF